MTVLASVGFMTCKRFVQTLVASVFIDERAGGLSEVEKSKTSEFPFGLLELDSAGTVVSFSPAAERATVRAPADVVGHNFFEEIAPVAEMLSFKGRFLAFMAFGDSAERYSFSFPFDDFVVAGQILLARRADRAEVGGQRHALVRLAPAG